MSANGGHSRSRNMQPTARNLLDKVHIDELRMLRVAVRRGNVTSSSSAPQPMERGIDDPSKICPLVHFRKDTEKNPRHPIFGPNIKVNREFRQEERFVVTDTSRYENQSQSRSTSHSRSPSEFYSGRKRTSRSRSPSRRSRSNRTPRRSLSRGPRTSPPRGPRISPTKVSRRSNSRVPRNSPSRGLRTSPSRGPRTSPSRGSRNSSRGTRTSPSRRFGSHSRSPRKSPSRRYRSSSKGSRGRKSKSIEKKRATSSNDPRKKSDSGRIYDHERRQRTSSRDRDKDSRYRPSSRSPVHSYGRPKDTSDGKDRYRKRSKSTTPLRPGEYRPNHPDLKLREREKNKELFQEKYRSKKSRSVSPSNTDKASLRSSGTYVNPRYRSRSPHRKDRRSRSPGGSYRGHERKGALKPYRKPSRSPRRSRSPHDFRGKERDYTRSRSPHSRHYYKGRSPSTRKRSRSPGHYQAEHIPPEYAMYDPEFWGIPGPIRPGYPTPYPRFYPPMYPRGMIPPGVPMLVPRIPMMPHYGPPFPRQPLPNYNSGAVRPKVRPAIRPSATVTSADENVEKTGGEGVKGDKGGESKGDKKDAANDKSDKNEKTDEK